MYLIDINVSAETDEYPSLRFQDIRKNKVSRTDTRTDNVKTVYPSTNKVCGGYNNKEIGRTKITEADRGHSVVY